MEWRLNMKIYSISYDLNTPGQDYTGLYNEIKKKTWWRYLDSNWLICTSESANEIYNRLKSHIDKNDSLLISEFGNDYQGFLPEKAWEWIREKKRACA